MSVVDDLGAEVRDLVARRDIKKALMRYMRGQDRLDADLHRSAFHDDAYIDCGLMKGGPDEFVAFAQSFLEQMEGAQHIIGQIDLDINGDTASGEVYFVAWHRIREDDQAKDLIVAGRYVDEYARRDGQWRIVKRREIVDWARSDPASDAFLAANPEIPRGSTRGNDFSQRRDWPQVG